MLTALDRPQQLREVPRSVLGQIGVIVIAGALLGVMLARIVWAPPPLKFSP